MIQDSRSCLKMKFTTMEVDHQEDDPEIEQHNTCPITNSQAAHMLEYQLEANEYNVCTLRQLRTLVACRREQSRKQTTLKDMLPLVTKIRLLVLF